MFTHNCEREYLNDLFEGMVITYVDLTLKKEEPYPRDHIFDIHETVIANREMVKAKNKEIHQENQEKALAERERREYVLLDIAMTIHENESMLEYHQVFNVIDYCLQEYLTPQERKLKKWHNVSKLLESIDKVLSFLDKILK